MADFHKKTSVLIYAEKTVRRLISFTEKKNEDVIISLFSGLSPGYTPTSATISQHRYTTHCSNRSNEFTTITKTFGTSNDETHKSSALTNCVKSKNGFTPIFFIRFTDLKTKKNDYQESDLESIEYLWPFNPSTESLIVGLFIGARDTVFETVDPTIKIIEILSKNFKFLIMFEFNRFPSLKVALVSEIITLRPEDKDGGIDKAIATLMESTDATTCIELFNRMAHDFTRQQLVYVHNQALQHGKIDLAVGIEKIVAQSFGGLEENSIPTHFDESGVDKNMRVLTL